MDISPTWCSMNSVCVCEMKIGVVYSETTAINKIWYMVENSCLMDNHLDDFHLS